MFLKYFGDFSVIFPTYLFNLLNMRKALIFLLCFSFEEVTAQWYSPEKVGKKAAALYGKSIESAIDGDITNAIRGMDACIRMDGRFVEAYLSRAGLHAELKHYDSSVMDFAKAFELDAYFSREYRLPYSISLAGIGKFKEAMSMVDSFLTMEGLNERSRKSGAYRKSSYAFAAGLRQKDSGYVFAPLNLGDSINSKDLEYYPSLTIDGSKMVFTRRANNDEDFFESKWKENKYLKARPLAGNVNTNLNEGAQNISQDGQWLVFTGCNYPEGEGSCDLYISYLTKKGNWTEPQNLGTVINTEFWESAPSLSPDKRDLYFASSRPGGYGGRDIWVSHLDKSGKWTQPENLGQQINTIADEGCAFIHPDNQTLYFNSNGHDGLGGTDIFLSRKEENGKWGKALNLGYPINTIDEEGSLVVAADGITAYYASDRSDSRGGLDLYTFKLPGSAAAVKTVWLRGKVKDARTEMGLPSKVELTDINTRKIISSLQTDEDGNYLVTLPEGREYAFHVNRKGYLVYSEHFSIENSGKDSAMVIDIPLEPIVAGSRIVLKNVFFDLNKFNLKPESLTELDLVVDILKENPSMKIEISGHTDNAGAAADNLKLSQARANAVVDYLQSKGINLQRLSCKGFGAQQPVSTNETAEGRALNRRTELKVVSN
jgi:outer membrane protein OmpA-like peptidoglycan-associated protein